MGIPIPIPATGIVAPVTIAAVAPVVPVVAPAPAIAAEWSPIAPSSSAASSPIPPPAPPAMPGEASGGLREGGALGKPRPAALAAEAPAQTHRAPIRHRPPALNVHEHA